MTDVMTIADIRQRLSQLDPGMVFPVGFGEPHSWRGDYYEPAVEPDEDVTVRQMIETLDRLVSETFTGWKGGVFTFCDFQELHIDMQGVGNEEILGHTMWELMVGLARIRAGVESQNSEDKEIAMSNNTQIVHILKKPQGQIHEFPTALPTAQEATLINALDALLETVRLAPDNEKVQAAYDGLLMELFEVLRPGLMISMTAVER